MDEITNAEIVRLAAKFADLLETKGWKEYEKNGSAHNQGSRAAAAWLDENRPGWADFEAWWDKP